MTGEGFYITLLSNSSFHLFPENRTSKFKVHLNKEVILDGDWSVALAEIIYPNTIINVSEGNQKISVKYSREYYDRNSGDVFRSTKSFTFKIKIGYYSSIKKLISAVNEAFKKYLNCHLFESEVTEENYVCVDQDGSKLAVYQLNSIKSGFVSFYEPSEGNETSQSNKNLDVVTEDVKLSDADDGNLKEVSTDTDSEEIYINTTQDVERTIDKRATPDKAGYVLFTETQNEEASKEIGNLVVTTELVKIYSKDEISQTQSVDDAVKAYEKKFVEVYLDSRLAQHLGFSPENIIFDFNISPNVSGVTQGSPKEVFVYIDCIEPQIISDVSAQVLKIVKTTDRDTGFGECINREILNRNYIPLNKNRFQVVSVELRDSTGSLIPFAFGNSIIHIHLKKST